MSKREPRSGGGPSALSTIAIKKADNSQRVIKVEKDKKD